MARERARAARRATAEVDRARRATATVDARLGSAIDSRSLAARAKPSETTTQIAREARQGRQRGGADARARQGPRAAGAGACARRRPAAASASCCSRTCCATGCRPSRTRSSTRSRPATASTPSSGAGELISVDSKFPFDNYHRIVEAPSDDERQLHEKAFARDVRNHIDAIAAKYIRPQDGTYDFAFMYVPVESVYYELACGATGDAARTTRTRSASSRVSPSTFTAYSQVIVLRSERYARSSSVPRR